MIESHDHKVRALAKRSITHCYCFANDEPAKKEYCFKSIGAMPSSQRHSKQIHIYKRSRVRASAWNKAGALRHKKQTQNRTRKERGGELVKVAIGDIYIFPCNCTAHARGMGEQQSLSKLQNKSNNNNGNNNENISDKNKLKNIKKHLYLSKYCVNVYLIEQTRRPERIFCFVALRSIDNDDRAVGAAHYATVCVAT